MTTIFFNDWRSLNYFLQNGNFISVEMELEHKKNDTATIEMVCNSAHPLDNGVCLRARGSGELFIEGNLLWAVATEEGPGTLFLSIRVEGQRPYYLTVGIGDDEEAC